ncbi:TlyA family RNA methyltransferase [Paramaledivibacter caminithermalis]|jgi:23S rRNA (cytidine1920-2'-O)/16S rRNA (cytidine1409-2'-O)-methyltransferase|uniref:23S rRNA (Cytidine1920-2'-O)/16S rRNA (Cytidine1409-2'-O)-methyltransferase n=1 Tax=Paramaledivibacter caminithermalis (strain DSM 15212 / CIP 107654 / DViRD3) TaxID=1121301 RepID=A0A1M6JQA6_PARC5|nr:TlyA family RNA methyltransferase [Paramaledivibacter caminithermalis]SHJ48822.1 23S rRNA (cytidine1920-2'-O)/16S rRNA (cytidine1409-2'-O)-methyltransferase [Paramaledivibacter caminithermalis DSM 15212]
MKKKVRIDTLLVERNYFESREKAKKSLMSGIVYVNNLLVDKPGMKVDSDADIEIKGKALPYVSRGGLKLEKAIKKYNIDLKGKICMDVGASTGGFTDCMLQNGAKKVYSIDVGYGQLDWKLRQDDRVISMERTNIRYVKPEDIEDKIDFASIDVSFISLKIVLPVVKSLVKENGKIVFLIKPQFEAGRSKVGKNGVVRDKGVHREVIEDILNFAIEIGLTVNELTFSPIKGPKGNREFLAYVSNIPSVEALDVGNIVYEVVEKAHNDLN